MPSISSQQPSTAKSLPLIPFPAQAEREEGTFKLTAETRIAYNKALRSEAKLFASDLRKQLVEPLQILEHESSEPLPSHIQLSLDTQSGLPPSGYRLEIKADAVHILGKDAAGVFYGTRTLLQLLPAATGAQTSELPALRITDSPRFGWRGMMIDSARHFISVKDIKSFIDWMAFHKLNSLHWHLSDDQGWRIEIKKYPKLTETGAYRDSSPPYGNKNGSDDTRYGAFYTQEQIKEVVAYAAERHITTIPEIDMPGHMAAAIAAYPDLGNSDIPNYAPQVQSHWGIHPYTLAPTEEVFQFVDDVFTEVCALFPSTYIHMGGDEALKTQWEQSPRVQALMAAKGFKNGHDVQSYFVKRVEKILTAKGRKLIGWDEIREGGLSPQATVMSWRGEDGGIASAQDGHDVVMCPESHMYFDYYQAPAAQELAKGLEYQAFSSFLPIEKVYQYDPIPLQLNALEAEHVLGVQANLWSEYMKDFKKMEYHAFPRIAALAEVAWSPLKNKDYPNFLTRLNGILRHYEISQINYGTIHSPALQATQDGTTVQTSLPAHWYHWPELAYDGSPESSFWSGRSLKAGDHFTLHFNSPVKKDSIVTVITGGLASRYGDQLENGILEASTDGHTWTRIQVFENGEASGTLLAGTRHVRILVTEDQVNKLIIHQITLT